MTDKDEPETPSGMEEAPSSASVSDHPDEDLLGLCDLYRRRWDEIMELNHQVDTARKVRGDAGPERREIKRLLADNENACATILSTPAHTVAGVFAKIRHHYSDAEIAAFGKDDEPDALPGNVAASVYGDLERLAREAAPIGEVSAIYDPVLVLKREWLARWERIQKEPDESDEARDPLYERLSETEYEVFQTPATTLAGVAFKLVLWARPHIGYDASGAGWSKTPAETYPRDLDELPVVSALHDLERLAGQA